MPAKKPDPGAGANPFGELAKFALSATERNTTLARNWSDALLTTLKEQSDDARAALTTLTASLEAMERALASQEETNREESAADATGVGDGSDGCHRAVHSADANVDRRLHAPQRRPITDSRSP